MPDRLFTRFTIGQFAALHGINKKTLMWYDEVGLLHPVAIGENGYRYYNYYQSSQLETILQLRDLNVSIPEIKAFLAQRSPLAMKDLLAEKIRELDERIARLERIRRALLTQSDAMERLGQIDLDAIELISLPERALTVISVDKHTPIETGVALMLDAAKKQRLPHLYDATYGSMIPAEHLYAGRFYDYTAMFLDTSQPPSPAAAHIRPAGQYLRAYSLGTWDKVPDRYRALLRYAGEHGLELYGHGYEICLNERVINSIDDYLTQIVVPVRPNEKN